METPAVTYSRFSRIVVAALVGVSRTSPLVLLTLLLFSPDPPANPLRLIRLFAMACLAPGLLAWLISRLFAARLIIENGTIAIEQRERSIEIPCDAITAIEPWVMPLPDAGVWLRLPSGHRFRYGIEIQDPAALIQAVADAGAAPQVRECVGTSAVVYAGAKHAAGRWLWYHVLLRYVIFALVPTFPLFRVHQWIAYGGTFGEYYQFGLKPYLLGFGVYWGTMIVYLVLWAAPWRALAEVLAYGAAFVAPLQAMGVRRAVELAQRVLYYGGTPILLALRFAS